MSSEDEKKYKDLEIKYKKVDVIARVVGALAAIASATAAFLALRNYTNNPAFAPQPLLNKPLTSPNQAIPNTSSDSTVPALPSTPLNQQVTPTTPPPLKQESLSIPANKPTAPSSKIKNDDGVRDQDDDDD
ncbi:hypothetical protein CEN43_09820 [Fischerella thermalis BR2B]|uniref:hypothetical protein n=1 Tax=Fischerella thermalis TaxID=372787 RepID=UPI0003159443|nr:hypothetical protein [Fischerella thermalis]PMB33506.1 hypothetical protein CEN43_09820 [Fischerella thermalis BR2B]